MFALASLSFIGRIGIRVCSRNRILLDDGFLIVSFSCLVASTSIFYKRARVIYLVFSLMRGDEVVSLIASQDIGDVYNQMNWSFAYMTFLWTAIFMVKFCYFAFFHTLLQQIATEVNTILLDRGCFCSHFMDLHGSTTVGHMSILWDKFL